MNTLQDRISGSLIGGAIGDALGYPIEFMSLKSIKHKYGDKGYIKHQEFNKEGKAVISDDTQMTLFTANGLLFGVTRFCTHGILGAGLKDFVAYAYQDWLQTQNGVDDYNAYHYCWIRDIVELNVRRAPGNTCMSALMSLRHHQTVENDSKGCGGVMRVAPVGLMAAADEQTSVKDHFGKEVPRRKWDSTEVARLGGDCAAITHKHPLGYLPAAFQADLIYYILMSEVPITFSVLKGYMGSVYADIRKEYGTDRERTALDELWQLIEKAIRLAGEWKSDADCIRQLGEGWTGDEALAIAVYCTMKHLDSFRDAVVTAVNHDGDSDSTGAICGNLMGAIVGYDAIPYEYLKELELKALIVDLADDLVQSCTISEYHGPQTPDEQQWEKRYVKIEPVSPKHFNGVFSIMNAKYHIMPQAQKVLEIKELFKQMQLDKTEPEILAYKIALKVFDTDNFDPYHPLEYNQACNEPKDYFYNRSIMPAYLYGFSDDEPVAFSKGNFRTFRINTLCFGWQNPVIAIRKDGSLPISIQLHGGLKPFYEETIAAKYPGWVFLTVDWMKYHYAFITHYLEKEFAIEIAHLWEDGTLHRIYHLFY